MKLNLGSYIYPLKDYWNVDIIKWEGVDQVVDLNKLPWPLTDNSFQVVRAVDIVEHLGKLTKTEIMGELARVTRPGGLVIIRVPCIKHKWAMSSLQHAHAFNYNSFEESYVQPWFKQERVSVGLSDNGKDYPLNILTRFLSNFGLVFTLTFILRKHG